MPTYHSVNCSYRVVSSLSFSFAPVPISSCSLPVKLLRKASSIMKMPVLRSQCYLPKFPDFLSSRCQQGTRKALFYLCATHLLICSLLVPRDPNIYFLLKSLKNLCISALNNTCQALTRGPKRAQITDPSTHSPFSVAEPFLSFHSSVTKQILSGI